MPTIHILLLDPLFECNLTFLRLACDQIQSVLKGGGALKLAGLDPEDQVREMLPRILTIDRCHELLSMRNCGHFESV